jgi:hypothetical protein
MLLASSSGTAASMKANASAVRRVCGPSAGECSTAFKNAWATPLPPAPCHPAVRPQRPAKGHDADRYHREMPDPRGIAAFLQRRLEQSGLDEVAAVEAAVWLDDAGVLKDSPTRPGLPLRELLRAGKILHAEQRPPFPNGRWYIVREGSRGAERWTRPATTTLNRDGGLGVSTRSGAGTQRPLPARAGEVGGARGVPAVQDDTSVNDAFLRAGLRARGFVGFQRFKGIDLTLVPALPGVYVVLREKKSRPVFLDRSPAGWFKGQDPTVPVAELEAAWPDGAHCVYIGKAGSGAPGGRSLRQRIREFRQYGDGRPVGHQGGRRIWQLADADEYVLSWLPTPGMDPEVLEAQLLRAFVAEYGRRPIGNRTGGRLS